MHIIFDPTKGEINRQKHDLSLAEAASIEWDTALERLDDRFDYGEDRYLDLGFIGNRLYCVEYADKGDFRRIISLRRANSREYMKYENS